MIKRVLLATAFLLLVGSHSAHAQTFPINKTFTWNANPVTDGVLQYNVTVDAGAVVIVVSPSVSTPVTFTTAGVHTLTVSATNMWGTGPATTLSINIVIPGAPLGARLQ